MNQSHTDDPIDAVRQFFADFEDASSNQDWEQYGEMFLPAFLNLDPDSAATVARDDLIAFLPHRKAVFDRARAVSTALTSLEVEPLDDRHVLARTVWEVRFEHERDPVSLRTTFILRNEDHWRVAVYLNHGSLLELLGPD